MRNINWLRALATIKEEMRCWTSGRFSSKEYVEHDYRDYFVIETEHSSCLGNFILKEKYYKNYYRFELTYDLNHKGYGGGGFISLDFIVDGVTDYIYTEEKTVKTINSKIDLNEKCGLFQLFKPSDLISFFRTTYHLSCSIESSKKEWRISNFVDSPRKYPEDYNYSFERIL